LRISACRAALYSRRHSDFRALLIIIAAPPSAFCALCRLIADSVLCAVDYLRAFFMLDNVLVDYDLFYASV